jgi:hypothetical protein
MLADAVVVLAGAWTLWDRHRHADEAVELACRRVRLASTHLPRRA